MISSATFSYLSGNNSIFYKGTGTKRLLIKEDAPIFIDFRELRDKFLTQILIEVKKSDAQQSYLDAIHMESYLLSAHRRLAELKVQCYFGMKDYFVDQQQVKQGFLVEFTAAKRGLHVFQVYYEKK
jgi:hypothetical protein